MNLILKKVKSYDNHINKINVVLYREQMEDHQDIHYISNNENTQDDMN